MDADLYKHAEWMIGKATLGDSKKMTERARLLWRARAAEWEEKGVVHIVCISRSAQDIDMRGIAVCIRECVAEGLEQLAAAGVTSQNSSMLLDGSLHAPVAYEQQTVIKGDSEHKIISLASVIAKVTRDALMSELSLLHPSYAWEKNKGYGTAAHYAAIAAHGLSPLHRKSFCRSVVPLA
jgi:ribonuclease HII